MKNAVIYPHFISHAQNEQSIEDSKRKRKRKRKFGFFFGVFVYTSFGVPNDNNPNLVVPIGDGFGFIIYFK